MRWLKTLVIGMGVAIVIGLTVVIVEVARRAGEPAPPVASGPAPPVIGAPSLVDLNRAPAMIGDSTIAIPPGATVVETVTDAARLVVRLRLADGRAALLLIDAATGGKLGMIILDDRADGGRQEAGK